MAVLATISGISQNVWSAPPADFANTDIRINAFVGVICTEVQHGSFPDPLMIDNQTPVDQIFAHSADQVIKCTKGPVFAVKVSSLYGTAVDQLCTSGGVSGMMLQSAGSPGDTIAYTFRCAGDTDGNGHFTGAGFATPISLGIGIRVAAADAQVAMARDDYSDIVTLTINY